MNKRPLSITIIAWLQALTSVGGVARAAMFLMFYKPEMANNIHHSLPLPMERALAVIVACLQIVLAVGFFTGKNWSRFLYVILGLIGLPLSILRSAMPFSQLLVAVAVYSLVVFFLFRPAANQYFNEQGRLK